MDDPLEIDVVVNAVRNAFRPLDCGVEVFDFEQKLRFRVFDPDGKPILRMSEMLMRRARDPKGLRFAINEARSRVEDKGFKLKPWKAPG